MALARPKAPENQKSVAAMQDERRTDTAANDGDARARARVLYQARANDIFREFIR